MLNFNIISNNSADYGGKKKMKKFIFIFFKGLFFGNYKIFINLFKSKASKYL